MDIEVKPKAEMHPWRNDVTWSLNFKLSDLTEAQVIELRKKVLEVLGQEELLFEEPETPKVTA